MTVSSSEEVSLFSNFSQVGEESFILFLLGGRRKGSPFSLFFLAPSFSRKKSIRWFAYVEVGVMTVRTRIVDVSRLSQSLPSTFGVVGI